MRLIELMQEFNTRTFVLANDRNVSWKHGRTVEYDQDCHAVYGGTEMFVLDDPHISEDGSECLYASDWIVDGDGDNPYRVRIYF